MGLLSSYLAGFLIFMFLHTHLILSIAPHSLNSSFLQDKQVSLALAKIAQQVENARCHIHVINLSKSQDLPSPSLPITVDSKLIKTSKSFRRFRNTCPSYVGLNVLQHWRVSCVFAIIVNANEDAEGGTERTLKRVQDGFNVVSECLFYLPLSKDMENVYGATTYDWNVGPKAPVFIYLTSNSSHFDGKVMANYRDSVWKEMVTKGLQYFALWLLIEHEIYAFHSSETVKRLCFNFSQTMNLCNVSMHTELGTSNLEGHFRNKVSILYSLKQNWFYETNDQEIPSKYFNIEPNLQLNPLNLPRENPNFDLFLITHLIAQENSTLTLCQSKGQGDCSRSTSSEVSIKSRIDIQRLLQVDSKIEVVLEKVQTFQFLTCYNEKRLSFQFYLDPFKPLVWGGLGLSLLTLSTLFHLYVRKRMPQLLERNFSPFLATLSPLCDDSYPAPKELQKTSLYRLVFGMWFLVSLIFLNSYLSLVIKGMLQPASGTSVERFEELLPALDRNPNATALRQRFNEKATFRWYAKDGNGEFQIFSTPTTKSRNRWGVTYQRTAFGDRLKEIVLGTVLARTAEVDKFTEEEVIASSFYWPRFIYSRDASNGTTGTEDSNSMSKQPGSTTNGQTGGRGKSAWKPDDGGQTGGKSAWKPDDGGQTGRKSAWNPNTAGKTGFNNTSKTRFNSFKTPGSDSSGNPGSKSTSKGLNNEHQTDSNATGNIGLKVEKLSIAIKSSAEEPTIIKSLPDPPPYWEDSSIEQEMVHCGRKAYVNAEDRVEAEFHYLSLAYPWIRFTLGKEKILPDVKVWSFSNYGDSKVKDHFKQWIQSGLFHKIQQYFQKAQYRLRMDFTRAFISTKFGSTQPGAQNQVGRDPVPLRLSDSVQTVFILYGGLIMGCICVYFAERFR